MTNKPDALPVVAEPCIECWCCHVPVTLNERSECDGQCPHCDSELDLDDYVETAVLALDELRTISDAASNALHAKCQEVITLQAELAAMREQKPALPEAVYVAFLEYEHLPLPTSPRYRLDHDRAAAKLLDALRKAVRSGGKSISYEVDPYAAPSQVAAEVVHTDCRSDEGVTVGLIDTIINSARLLKGRAVTPAVMSAVEDLLQDEDLRALLATSKGEA